MAWRDTGSRPRFGTHFSYLKLVDDIRTALPYAKQGHVYMRCYARCLSSRTDDAGLAGIDDLSRVTSD